MTLAGNTEDDQDPPTIGRYACRSRLYGQFRPGGAGPAAKRIPGPSMHARIGTGGSKPRIPPPSQLPLNFRFRAQSTLDDVSSRSPGRWTQSVRRRGLRIPAEISGQNPRRGPVMSTERRRTVTPWSSGSRSRTVLDHDPGLGNAPAAGDDNSPDWRMIAFHRKRHDGQELFSEPPAAKLTASHRRQRRPAQ